MSEPKSPLDQALDIFVYAPVGIALTAAEELPKLIDKGRQRVTGQIGMARMMGQFAVMQGQKEAEKLVRQATDRIADLTKPPEAPAPKRPATRAPVVEPAGDEPGVTEVATPRSSNNGAATNGSATTGTAMNGSTATPSATTGSAAPKPSADLAIPGYDALSASQVVQRLAGLSPDELEQVRAYETASRGRKTILSRIAQLQADSR